MSSDENDKIVEGQTLRKELQGFVKSYMHAAYERNSIQQYKSRVEFLKIL